MAITLKDVFDSCPETLIVGAKALLIGRELLISEELLANLEFVEEPDEFVDAPDSSMF